MSTAYNIYRIRNSRIKDLITKLSSTELVEQKTLESNEFKSTFFYSEDVKGNDVWWWQTYNVFMNNTSIKPSNKFHYGLLISVPRNPKAKYSYLISLGKSHFYLSEFIERDFGINLAIRMANEASVLLKKSTYFSSMKKGDLSSYQKFIPDNYEPGESVDHLKLKAKDTDLWGDKYIIFSDSVQLNDDTQPHDIEKVLSKIDKAINGRAIISLPKLEMVKRTADVEELDKILIEQIRNSSISFSTSEFEILGTQILLTQEKYNYELFTRIGNGSFDNREKIGNIIDAQLIHKYISSLANHFTIDNIRVKCESESCNSIIKPLKDCIEFSTYYNNESFFLRNGIWHKFNKTFMAHLKTSLGKIKTVKSKNLDESKYILWRDEKLNKIKLCKLNNTPALLDNHLTYREYYFNQLMSQELNYELWDRDNKLLPSMNNGGKTYKVEIADLYKNNEIISLKISEDISQLIYNIAQSTTAIELIKKKSIKLKKDIKIASLWFVFDRDIKKITDFNSVQFLIAVQSWKQTVLNNGLEPRIIISKRINK